ncbi:hypothetical protein DSO57_1033850 [Entomophthora muscae]|uniref:Uncharacterized protein n=1 Tax=Entomophthora muscae TaxID=34485 RepID=A0ACC2T0H8_9FUNG|nr:hypothetical protein DSO57_1033850 [Entomophthora muscae]
MPPKPSSQAKPTLPADFFDSDKKQYIPPSVNDPYEKTAVHASDTDVDLSTLDQEFLEFEKEIQTQNDKAAGPRPASKEDTAPREVSEKDILDFDNSISREEDEEIAKQEMVLRLQLLQQKRKNMLQLPKDAPSTKKPRSMMSKAPSVGLEGDSDSDDVQQEPDWWAQAL